MDTDDQLFDQLMFLAQSSSVATAALDATALSRPLALSIKYARRLEDLFHQGHASVAEKLLQYFETTTAFMGNDGHLLKMLVAHDYLELIRWLTFSSQQSIDLTVDQNRLFRTAAMTGRFELMKWLVEESGQRVDATAAADDALRHAAATGHFEIVRWIVEDWPAAAKQNPAWAGCSIPAADITSQSSLAVRTALIHGQLEIACWLLSKEGRTVFYDCDDAVAWRAASFGHREILQWMFEETGLSYTATQLNKTLQSSIDSEQENCVTYLLQSASLSILLWMRDGSLHPRNCSLLRPYLGGAELSAYLVAELTPTQLAEFQQHFVIDFLCDEENRQLQEAAERARTDLQHLRAVLSDAAVTGSFIEQLFLEDRQDPAQFQQCLREFMLGFQTSQALRKVRQIRAEFLQYRLFFFTDATCTEFHKNAFRLTFDEFLQQWNRQHAGKPTRF